MAEYILVAVIVLAFILLLIRHLGVKRQIRNIVWQLQESEPRRRSVSIELFDGDIKALTLTINRAIEEYSQMSLENEKEIIALKNSIADISHDMRTPLTSTIGYLQLLSKEGTTDEGRQYLNIALDKSGYLRKLLTDFHELAVLSAKETLIELEKFDLAAIVSNIILENANEFSKKEITPIFEQFDTPVFIMGEVKMLQRAIQNLVSNCLKYSSGDVVFTITAKDMVTLAIINPADNLENLESYRLFERFYRGDISRKGQGVGLGLPIARLLVENMGGKISVDVTHFTFAVYSSFPTFSPCVSDD